MERPSHLLIADAGRFIFIQLNEDKASGGCHRFLEEIEGSLSSRPPVATTA